MTNLYKVPKTLSEYAQRTQFSIVFGAWVKTSLDRPLLYGGDKEGAVGRVCMFDSERSALEVLGALTESPRIFLIKEVLLGVPIEVYGECFVLNWQNESSALVVLEESEPHPFVSAQMLHMHNMLNKSYAERFAWEPGSGTLDVISRQQYEDMIVDALRSSAPGGVPNFD